MAGGRVDTMGDYLRKIMGLLGDAKITGDADLPFILGLEQQVVGKLRGPTDQAQQAGQGAAPGAPDMSGPAGGGMPPGAGGPQAIPIQSGGLQAGPQQPSTDELRRLLTRQ